jgi:asparagine synthase (glutamine-hydrolysing)
MCGIAGILVRAGAAGFGSETTGDLPRSAASIARRMVAALAHRGPDGRAVQTLDAGPGVSVAFGHTRLAILDLSPDGRQPMPNPGTGDWITHNGEVYNFAELRSELRIPGREEASGGGGWRSRTDTETILHAYGKWGEQCLERLRGMFAFAIWDARRRRLFAARDRLGIKPLYYFTGDGFFLFASEVRALIASGLVPRRLDRQATWEFLGYQSVPSPRTLVEGVSALPPGGWLRVKIDGTVETHDYWDLLERASAEARTATPAESRRHVGDLLREAIDLHLVSDVPVGTFLSGGIDSSAVVALIREAGQVPRTFSVAFPERAYDETHHARRIAARFGADHSEILLKESDLLDQLPDALGAMDQPTGDGVNTYVVSRAVRSAGMKVALSGLGGDEFFGGYPSFHRAKRAARCLTLWGRLPAALRASAGRAVGVLGDTSIRGAKLAALVESDGTLPAMFPILRQLLSRSQRRALLADSFRCDVDEGRDAYVGLLESAFASAPRADTFARISYAEGRTYMHDVLLRDTDQMSMAHGLEVRVPLLDHRLVEYLMGLPDAHKRPNGIPKRLLIESLGGLLPDEVVRRPKQGFVLPLAPWMRGALRGFCQERLQPGRTEARGLFRPDAVQRLWRAFLNGRDRLWSRIWTLVVLEEWLDQSGMRDGG